MSTFITQHPCQRVSFFLCVFWLSCLHFDTRCWNQVLSARCVCYLSALPCRGKTFYECLLFLCYTTTMNNPFKTPLYYNLYAWVLRKLARRDPEHHERWKHILSVMNIIQTWALRKQCAAFGWNQTPERTPPRHWLKQFSRRSKPTKKKKKKKTHNPSTSNSIWLLFIKLSTALKH